MACSARRGRSMQFLASPVLGALSDRFGRRPIILLSNFGLGLDYILMALAPTLGWLLMGRIVSGVTSASIGTAFAYVADVTTPENAREVVRDDGRRVRHRLHRRSGAGRRAHEHQSATAVLGVRVPSASPTSATDCSSFRSRCRRLASRGVLVGARQPRGIAEAAARASAAHAVSRRSISCTTSRISRWPRCSCCTAGYRYGWTPTDVGWALAGVGVSFAIVQAGLVGRLVATFGEWRMLIAGLSFGATGMAIYGIAPTGLMFAARDSRSCRCGDSTDRRRRA